MMQEMSGWMSGLFFVVWLGVVIYLIVLEKAIIVEVSQGY